MIPGNWAEDGARFGPVSAASSSILPAPPREEWKLTIE